MKTIDYNELNIISYNHNSDGFAEIDKCIFNGDEPSIINFDNVSLNNSNVDISSLNDYSAGHIKRLGINKGLD